MPGGRKRHHAGMRESEQIPGPDVRTLGGEPRPDTTPALGGRQSDVKHDHARRSHSTSDPPLRPRSGMIGTKS